MAGNRFADRTLGNDLCANAEKITPSDAASFDAPVRIVPYDGEEIRVTTVGGQTVTIPVVPGLMLPILVTKVHATGTDATKIFGYW